MPPKTWFLPPDLTFRPDGEISLGTIIKHPKRPTACLARLSQPDLQTAASEVALQLPEIESITEKSHIHSRSSSSEFRVHSFAKVPELASFSASANPSMSNITSFSEVDHEVRTFKQGIPPETLRAIAGLESVSRHITSGILGSAVKKPVYIISGLRIVQQPLKVTDEKHKGLSLEFEASGPTGAPVPFEGGGEASGKRQKDKVDSYETEAGIVFAYRLHVLRQAKGTNTLDAELFTHRTAFLSGEVETKVEEVDLEYVEVDADVLLGDLNVEPDFQTIDAGSEKLVLF